MAFRFVAVAGLFVILTTVPLTAASSVTDGLSTLSVEEMKTALDAVPQDIAKTVTSDRGALSRFFGTFMQEQRIAAAATASGYAERPRIRAMMDKARRDVLIGQYIDDQLAQISTKGVDFRTLAREQFDVNRKNYVRPEAVRLAHILFAVDVEDERFSEDKVRARAEDVLAQLKSGADFAKLAKQFSGDRGSSTSGGELKGWVERGKLVPPFEKVAFALQPGETSGLVRTRFGFHIVRKLEHRKESQQSFSEVEAQIVDKLRSEYLTQRRDAVLKPFIASQPVEITDEVFEILKSR
jgi:parvulin-like peptidyl-prolyl isomerase